MHVDEGVGVQLSDLLGDVVDGKQRATAARGPGADGAALGVGLPVDMPAHITGWQGIRATDDPPKARAFAAKLPAD